MQDTSKDIKGKKSSKAGLAAETSRNANLSPSADITAEPVADPNANKFIPGCVHFERVKHSSTQPFVDLLNYNSFLKTEEQFGIVYGDHTYESNQTMMMDWAFAVSCSHINLKGLGRVERSSKVDRF